MGHAQAVENLSLVGLICVRAGKRPLTLVRRLDALHFLKHKNCLFIPSKLPQRGSQGPQREVSAARLKCTFRLVDGLLVISEVIVSQRS